MSDQTASSPEAPPAMTEVEELRDKLASFEYAWQRIREVLPTEAPTDTELVEALRLARAWEEKYFEMGEKRTADAVRAETAEATVAAARAFAEDMRTWCSPHGVAADYADRLLNVLNGEAGR